MPNTHQFDRGWESITPTQKYTVEESNLMNEAQKAWQEFDKYVDKTFDREEIFNFTKYDDLLAEANKADQNLESFRRKKNE